MKKKFDMDLPRHKRFIGKARANLEGGRGGNIEDGGSLVVGAQKSVKLANRIPVEILEDKQLNEAIGILPANYEFEIHKTVWHVRRAKATRVALQMPEGLLMFGCTIADIIERFCNVETLVMGDVTYGACCVDDFTARALGCDFLVHYGHSCLVPVDQTPIKTLYVFVDIRIDPSHLIATLDHNFKHKNIAMVGTIQFVSMIHLIRHRLASIQVTIPQAKPLSPGEILGCTAPVIPTAVDAIVYVGDGRFHLEAIMIANPSVPAYRYDPYSRQMSSEAYDHATMRRDRAEAVRRAKHATTFGLILGTLGRQGSPRVLHTLEALLARAGKQYTIVLLSEIFPAKLNAFTDIDAWIQIACPRLSIDWGYAFDRPLLSPYEATLALEEQHTHDDYPMDFYANDARGPYAPNYGKSTTPSKPLLKMR